LISYWITDLFAFVPIGGIAMKRLTSPSPLKVLLVAAATLFGTMPRPVAAESPVKMENFLGTVDVTASGFTPFTLYRTASHLGKFTAYGEVEFVPGEEPGALEGTGVVVFEAADGDLLVGHVAWEVDAGDDYRTSSIHFKWGDSVQFHDGTVVADTGRFVDDRPPGLVVIAIIAILAAILFPVFSTSHKS
jgi:hypothetical protein